MAAWRAQNSPGAHRSHGAHRGESGELGAMACRDSVGWYLEPRQRHAVGLSFEKLGDGVGGGGGGWCLGLRGAATRWPWWAALTEVEESASLHLPREGFDSLSVCHTHTLTSPSRLFQ